ncbi:Beta-hexosaminidase [Lachnellula suecica]|uniref:beta-N-acetylhexosaminidase n=1 Tax=Lachnellula suecica TaxID=602035 RepID=A0A8T9CHT6_9HELO|nr:Beta-hexosaminidase [Lachnellula suecica]
MRLISSILLVLLPLHCGARWTQIPTVPFESTTGGSFSLKQLKSIVVDSNYQDAVNTDGETLIPPTLLQFSKTFSGDLSSSLGLDIPVVVGNSASKDSIFMTIGNSSHYLDAAGRPTSEGYLLGITSQGITVTGASSLGAWWATRSILQQAVLNDGMNLDQGSATDAPGWGIRGTFLDVGRHYYPPEFIIEMCSYLSFFKQNTFHLHLSDASNLNPNISYERKLEFYSAFRLNSPDSVVSGLNKRPNESYYEPDFENMQQSCASRGVTIIPEIEAPGHALPITQWKPELALSTDFSLLNISNPETIPTMQRQAILFPTIAYNDMHSCSILEEVMLTPLSSSIWSTFIPWFHSKTVHLGADEYSSAEIEEYNRYVNNMHDYIGETFGKKVRIWGTFPPSHLANETNVNTNVSFQHWEFFEDNPYFDFIKNGYSVLNSDDSFYVVAKYSGSYPQVLNLTRVFYGAPDGGPMAPYIFDRSNATNNPPRDSPYVLGQLPALWNDFGPNSTSVIEAYYALRNALPALGDKQWGGDLLMEEYNSVFEKLHAAIPGQNLDRRVASKTSTILSYDFSNTLFSAIFQKVYDKSGNGYDASLKGGILSGCGVFNSVLTLRSGCSLTTPLTSKGRNYTLSFSVKPASSTPGTLFSGSASSLLAGNGSINNVMMVTNGHSYILNYTLPVNTWTDVRLVGINNATYFSVTPEGSNDESVYEFTATLGILDNSFVWGNVMAFEAPISTLGGDTFTGQIKNVQMVDGADAKYAAMVAPLVIGVAPYT